MAVRLACPSCGAAFTPKPADAGRVVPCKRCGSDLQMPDAAPPTAQAAPRRHTREPEYDEDDRPAPRPRSGAPLLLLTLFATGMTGLFLGASVFYFALRQQPAPAPQPVAQKPADPQPADPTPAPKVEPKAEAPKVEPKAVAPKAAPLANLPRVPGLPGVQGLVVAADTIPGLKFYLACDRFDNGQPVEAVSGKPVGTGFGLAITDGPRGDAVRLTHDRKQDNRFALDLSDAKELFTIPADRPFTLSFWARRVNADALSGFGAFLIDANSGQADRHARSFYAQMLPTTPALVAVKVLDVARSDPNGRNVQASFRVTDPTAWSHYALTRDDNNRLRLLVNGFEAPSALPQLGVGELRYEQIGLLRSAEGKTVVDLDELCLFDRVLTADELGRLGGKKAEAAPPKPVAVEAKLPPPGAVPPATDFKGLKLYLPCNGLEPGGALAEVVSGKNIGRGQRLDIVDGPRGKAVRATVGGAAPRTGFDLTPHVDALAIGEGKPFTLAMWVRTDNWENVGGYFVDGKFSAADRFRTLSLYRYTKGFGFLLQQGKPGGGGDADAQLARGTFETPPRKDWVHLALTRDEKGTVRMAVDGETAVVSKGAYTAELRFTMFSLVWQQGPGFVADFDEVCLFDRVLTDDELARLAGKKPKDAVAVGPKDPPMPPVGPKDPPPMPPIPPKDAVAVAPPPRAVIAGAEPPVIAPKDPPMPAPAAVAVSAPAGADPKGLLLYLPFDEVKDKQVREGVSGKFAGSGEGVELVKGVRGQAARLSAEGARLELNDLAERATVPAGQPFAVALWLRVEPREAGAKVSGGTAVQFGVRPDREYDRALQFGYGSAGTLHGVARSTPDRLDDKRETAARWVGIANHSKWLHVAMVRDEKNVVRWYINGKAAPQPGKSDPTWDGPLGFDRLFIGDAEQTKAILEVDELCVFGRALTAEELKKLAEPPK